WESLKTYDVPEWYRDAKFGIFIHWGVYSVPAFGNEWYPRNMYREGSEEYKHHIATYGAQDKFGYKEFIPMFKAEHFDPAAWAELFKKAGAKYVVPVAEHHDGFAMYDSGLSDWTAAKMGLHSITTLLTSPQNGRTIGSRAARNWSRSTIPISCTSIGGSGSRRSVRI